MSCSFFDKYLEHIMGVRVNDTIKDTVIPAVTTTANDSKKRPIMPSIYITGAKIQIKAKDEARTAKTTSLLPLIAALKTSLSMCFWCLKIFSRTTIASSTTTPISRISAKSVMLLKV